MNIEFMSANNGGIDFYCGVGENNFVGHAKSANMVAYIVKVHGVAENIFLSSSMDFADEYGFENEDGAKQLWDDGMVAYKEMYGEYAA